MRWSMRVPPISLSLISALRLRPAIPGTFLPREIQEGGMVIDEVYVPGGVCSIFDITKPRHS